MILRAIVLACASVLLGADAHAATRCLDDPGDAAQIAAARTAVDAACDCFGLTHGKYVACAVEVVKARADALLLRTECKGTVKRIYAISVCGRPISRNGPFFPCVSLFSPPNSPPKVGCAIRPVFACSGTSKLVRTACLGKTTCLDAADTNGDLRIDGYDLGDCTVGGYSSFTDNGDGTITDDGTSLMWEKLSDDGSIHDWTDVYTWDDNFTPFTYPASIKISALNGAGGFAGYTDWRLPTIAELQTLIRVGSSPAIDAAFNTGCAPDCSVTTCSCTYFNGPYWSSSPYALYPNYWGWGVQFFGGSKDVYYHDNFLSVRAVRGGF